jgi:hypothetical protein
VFLGGRPTLSSITSCLLPSNNKQNTKSCAPLPHFYNNKLICIPLHRIRRQATTHLYHTNTMVHISVITTATSTAVSIAVSLASALTLVSAHPNIHLASSSSSGHGPHALEKRAPAAGPSCSTTYTPVAAGQYPAIDCVPFIQDPQVQTWLKLVDFSKTPVFPPSQKGVCPTDKTTIPQDQCWWTCQKCDAPDDITSCPATGTWGLTFDGNDIFYITAS